MRKLILVGVVAALGLAVGAPAVAGGGGGYGNCPGFAAGDTIVMRDSCFAGTAHFAPPGHSITVTNEGILPHSYTAVDGSFDSGVLEPGESFEFVASGGGLVEVFCSLHGTAQGDGMAGILVVDGASSPASVPGAVTPEPPDTLTPQLVAALDRQSEAIAELTAQEAALLGRLVTSGGEAEGWPAPLTVVLVVAALALAGIVVATRAPGRTGIEQRIGRPEQA